MWHIVPVSESANEGKAAEFHLEPKSPQQCSTLPSQKFVAASSWPELCSEVAKTCDFQGVSWTPDIDLLRTHRTLFILLAALKVSNQEMVAQLSMEKDTSRFWDAQSGQLDDTRLIWACLGSLIASGCEEFACAVLEMLRADLPLHLVHRAGERGLTWFLACVVRFNIPVKPNSVIASLPFKVQSFLRRRKENKFQRFPARNRFLTEAEVLRWAALVSGREGVRAVLQREHALTPASIAEVLLSEGLSDLLFRVLSESQLARVPMDCLLQYGQLHLAIQILAVSATQKREKCLSRKTPKTLRSYKVISKLIPLIVDPRSSLSALYLLSLIKKAEWNLPETELAYETLKRILLTEDVEKTTICNHCNPLLLCVALCEFCEQLSQMCLQLRERFLKLSEDFLRLAEHIQSQYVDYHRLKVLYLEKNYGPLCLFDVIVHNSEKYRALLKSDTVAAIAQDLWTGGDPVGLNFNCFSLIDEYFEDYDGSEYRLHELPADAASQSLFQLHQWKTNNSLRFIFETAMFIGMFGMLVSQIVLYLDAMKIMENPDMYAQLDDAMKKLQTQLRLTYVILGISGAVVFGIVQQVAYKKLLGETFAFSSTDVLSIVFCLCVACVLALGSSDISAQMDQATNGQVQEYLYSLIMFTICLRISSVFTQTRTFGPWIRMIFIIVKDTVVFLVIYLLAVVSFAMTYVILFRRDGDYFGSIELSIRTLFQWSVGGIDATVFTYHIELGSVLAIVWGFVSTVILLNLLIAVLSSRFDELAPQITADYVSIMYRSYSQTRYEPPFGSLVIAPAPFNLLAFPLVPIYLLYPSAAPNLNTHFVLLSYLPMFFIGLLLFMTYLALTSIVAYVYVLGLLLGAGTKNWMRAVQWLLVGPFYLFYLSGLSLVHFIKAMYREPEEKQEALPQDVLSFTSAFVKKISDKAHLEQVTVSLCDIEAAIAHLPHRKTRVHVEAAPLLIEKPTFRQIAERIYFSKSQLTNARSRSVLDFIAQFRSYDSDNINITRIAMFLQAYRNRPEKLAAVNIFFVQKALIKMRREIKEAEE